MDSPGSSCLCTLVLATTSWLSSTPPTPTAQSTSSHSLPSSQPVSTMLHSTVVLVFIFSISFPLVYASPLESGTYRHAANPNRGGTREQSLQMCLPNPSRGLGLWTHPTPINLHQRGPGLWTQPLLQLCTMDTQNPQL